MGHDAREILEAVTPLDRIIAGYLEAEATGMPAERDALLRRHPELADDLRTFFANHDRARCWAEPLRPAVPTPLPVGKLPTLAPGETGPLPVLESGQTFADYELLEELGRGGMGVVFKARHVHLHRTVAVKMILAGGLASPEDVRRFRTEAEAVAQLDHPNIVPLYEVGEHQGWPFFSMKFVEGGSLAHWIADCRLQIADLTRDAQVDVARLLAQVARAVHHAHQRGILHRDLKPANILLQAADFKSEVSNLKSAIPHVTDFGLAKRLQVDGRLTQSGAIVGSPAYMAPEQAAARPGLSTAADVYSLGAILFELLIGRPPFRADSTLETLKQVIEQEPPRPRALDPRIDHDLETVCLKCLEKDSARRYRSAEALAEDLEHWLAGEPIRARRSPLWEQAVKWARRRPAVAALVGLSILAPVALLIVGLVFNAQLQLALGDVRTAREEAGKENQAAHEANRQAQQARKTAEELVAEADGMRLIAESRVALPDNATLALLLAIEGAKRGPRRAPHNNALAAAWSACRERGPVLAEHDQMGVEQVAFFPDGRRVMTRTYRTIRVWERATGKLLARWDGPGMHITSAVLSPDGRRIVATYEGYRSVTYRDGRVILYTDQAARIWDLDTGRETVLKGHANRVASACFSPDGKRLLTASFDETARIWDVAGGKLVRVLRGHRCALNLAGFSADGTRIFTVSSGFRDSRKMEGAETQKATAGVDPPVPTDAIEVVSSSSSLGSSRSFVAWGESFARIWDAGTGKELKALLLPPWTWHGGTIEAAFSPDGRRLLTVYGSDARVWNVETGAFIRLSQPTTITVSGSGARPAFSPDGKLVLTGLGPRNNSLGVWDAATGKEVAVLSGHDDLITSARFTPTNRVLTTSADKTCRLWSLSGKEEVVLRGHELGVHAADLSPDGLTVITGSEDGTARFWHVGRQPALGTVLSEPGRTTRAVYSPDGRLVATGSYDGTLRLWDAMTGKLRTTWRSPLKPTPGWPAGDVVGLAFSPDGRKLLSVSADPLDVVEQPGKPRLSHSGSSSADSLSRSCSGVSLSTSHQRIPGGQGTPRRS